MQLGTPGRPHLTYCTNIHPGESLADVRRALVDHVARVRSSVHPDGRFGVGLRLSALAAEELCAPGALDAFRALLHEHELYVFTINGFPYGAFHGTRVKESVYRPDWTEEARLAYTSRLAEILAALLPPDVDGSISTVPGAIRDRARGRAKDMAERLLRQAAALHALHERTGKQIELSLEPEPACFLETTDEVLRFFDEELFCDAAVRRFSALTGLPTSDAASSIRRHPGVCFDACHLAVEFEDARASVAKLRESGVRIGKIQITAAPVVRLQGRPEGDAAMLSALRRFVDPVYLHQVVVKDDTGLRRFLDLPDALAGATAFGERPSEWRTHFHVPVHESKLGPFTSTQPFLRDLLALVRTDLVSGHLEVETYTWDVLPAELRALPLSDSIARELTWTLAELGEPLPVLDRGP